jgi:hypothetical protein
MAVRTMSWRDIMISSHMSALDHAQLSRQPASRFEFRPHFFRVQRRHAEACGRGQSPQRPLPWPDTDLLPGPRLVGYPAQSGLAVLTLCLIGVDPQETFDALVLD